MEKRIIGENAGIVWRTLESKGSLSYEQLQAETELDMAAMFAAIGWLAREDKISFNKENGITSVCLYQERYY
ncbi:MAG: winged helix-turn-helix domain-containing protein [Bacteroidaceae bacterium]|nr:winged helix-turn-helix domain-containing protein [Bacteroidaceae bacterium]